MISVIIPARNAKDTLEGCLEAVLKQRGLDQPYEVIVVDDGSIDGTANVAKRLDVQLLHLDGQGPAAARNTGVVIAKGDLIAFTDSDCEPTENWLVELIRPFDDPAVVGTRGAYRSRQQNLVARFVQLEYAFKYERMMEQDSIDFIDTYSAAYRREVFLENDGFETAFTQASVEDQEFSFRLARKGYRMVFTREAIVYHRHDESILEYARRKFNIGYWKAFLLKWLPEKAFSDSHTPGTQRLQVGLLGLAILTGFISLLWPIASLAAGGSLLLFLITSIPILAHVVSRDMKLIFITPVLLLVRAGALGLGLFAGLLFPPRKKPAYLEGFSLPIWFFKRAIDIMGAAIGLIVSAPIMGLSAMAIKLDSPGPALFFQDRVGEGGKVFRMVKLRTMVPDAEAQVQKVLATNPLKGPVFKIPNDPRVTRVGRVLRRLSLDELPQLWNVLRGEMSLVGPRPEEAWIVAQYDDRQRARLAVKPGLTGPAQIAGRGDLDMDQRLNLELDYIRDYSVLRDVGILLRSIPAVITGRGAY